MARRYMQLVLIGVVTMLVSIAFGAAAVGTKWAQLTTKNPIWPLIKEKVDVGIFNGKYHRVVKLPVNDDCNSAYVARQCSAVNDIYRALNPKNCESECRESSSTVRTKFDFVTKDYTDAVGNDNCYNFDAPVGLLICALALQALVIIIGGIACILTQSFGFTYMLMCLWFCGMFCAFVIQIVGFILATVFSMRPCERTADIFDRDVSMAFGFGLASLILSGFATALFLVTTCILNREESTLYASESDEIELRPSPMALAQTVVPTVTQMVPPMMPAPQPSGFVVVPQQYAPFPPVQGLYEQQVIYKEGM